MQIPNVQNYNHETYEEKMMKNTRHNSRPSFLSLLLTVDYEPVFVSFEFWSFEFVWDLVLGI
jgi:hypothetical protein